MKPRAATRASSFLALTTLVALVIRRLMRRWVVSGIIGRLPSSRARQTASAYPARTTRRERDGQQDVDGCRARGRRGLVIVRRKRGIPGTVTPLQSTVNGSPHLEIHRSCTDHRHA